MNLSKILLSSFFLLLVYKIEAQNFSNKDLSKEDFIKSETILKHKITKVRVSNTCHSFEYNIHSNKYECENKTNTHYYYFNNLGLLDSFFIKEFNENTLLIRYYNYDDELRLVKSLTFNGHDKAGKEENFYSYGDNNKIAVEWSLTEKDGYDTIKDTTRYIWKGDTCVSINNMGGSPFLRNCNYVIVDDKGNGIEYGRYDFEQGQVLEVTFKKIYKNQRLVRSISLENDAFTEGDNEDYFFYEIDKSNRIIKKIEQLQSGKAFYTTKYIYKGDKITQLIYKNELSGDSYTSTFEYFNN